MKTVFILHHVHLINYENDIEDIKLIGSFSSKEKAITAIKELVKMPGFKEFPDLLQEMPEQNQSGGFFLSEYELDLVHWKEGFGEA